MANDDWVLQNEGNVATAVLRKKNVVFSTYKIQKEKLKINQVKFYLLKVEKQQQIKPKEKGSNSNKTEINVKIPTG